MDIIGLILTLIILLTVLFMAVVASLLGKAMGLDKPFKMYLWVAAFAYLIMNLIFQSHGG